MGRSSDVTEDPVNDPTQLASSDDGTASTSSVDGLRVVGASSYTRRGEIARGGLGRIIEATDRRLRRVVALKELRRHSPEAAARFVREAMVTARLQHPGIIPIYEAGRWPDGEPFYAMRLVSGASLAESIAARKTLDQRLSLLPRVIAVVDTIAYAHSQRVIHRDLKPHNVMCGAYGETVVIDWGLAKDLDAHAEPAATTDAGDDATPEPESSSSSSADATQAGTVMGTPGYMAPEQARGEAVDERADVYALGAVLHHVLAGTAPKGEPMIDGVPRDLAAIVARAMAREPADRYPSARELAEDLRRFQTGNLVSVREYGAAERLARWLRRYRATAAVAGLALLVVAVIGAIAMVRVLRERDRANHEARDAGRARDDLLILQAKGQLDRDATATLAWLGQVSRGRLDAATADIAAHAVSRGVASHVLRLEDGRIHGVAVGGDGRGWALGRGGRLFEIDLQRGAVRVAHDGGENAVVFAISGDGAVAAVSMAQQTVVLAGVAPTILPAASPAISLALDATGGWLAIGQLDGAVWLRSLRDGTATRLDAFGAEVREIRFSPDGAHLAAVGLDGTVGIYQVAGGAQVLRGRHPPQVWALAWAPDGRAIATGGEDGAGMVWTLDGAPPRKLVGHTAPVLDVAFAADRIATASRDHDVRLWSRDGTPVATLPHTDQVLCVIAAPDGGGWASGGSDRTVRRWDADGAPLAALRGHEDFITALAFAPGGETLMSTGQDGSVRIWPTVRDHEVLLRGATVVRIDAGGETIAAIRDGRLLVGAPGHVPVDRGAAEDLDKLAFADGGVVLGVGPAGRIVRFSDSGPRALVPAGVELGGAAEVDGVVFGAGYDSQLWRWRDTSSAPVGLPGHASYVLNAIRIPGTALVATGAADGTVRVWDRDGRVVRVLHDAEGPVHRVAASPDGTLLAAGDGYGTVVIWQLSDGAERARYRHGGMVQGLAFSAASDRLASAGDDKVVLVWSADGGVRTFEGATATLTAVAVSPDGALVAAAGADGTIRCWEIATGVHRVLRGHRVRVGTLRFTPAGELLSGDDDGTLVRWPVAQLAPPPVTDAAVRTWMGGWTDATIDETQRPATPAP